MSGGGVPSSVINNINQRVSSVENRLHHLDKKVERVEKKAAAGIAGAMAAASVPQANVVGKSVIGAGVETYRDKSAIAIGWSRTTDSGKVILRVNGAANSIGDFSASAGIGFQY